MSDSAIQAHKDTAVHFLQLVIAGRIAEAYQAHVDPQGKHHNAFFAAGFPALQQAMLDNHVQFPEKRLTVQHVLGDGDLVAVHFQLIPGPGSPAIAAVHLYRFAADKIVELWDIGQAVPADSPNADGAF